MFIWTRDVPDSRLRRARMLCTVAEAGLPHMSVPGTHRIGSGAEIEGEPCPDIGRWLSLAGTSREARSMKIKVKRPVSIRVGAKTVLIRPHQQISVSDDLGKRLIERDPDRIKKVKR